MKRRQHAATARGERTNVIVRDCSRTCGEEKWEEASEIARRQVRGGRAHRDVCLQSTERDERDIPPFYEKANSKVKAPDMIDTTDPTAIELALTYCQARRSSIRSISRTARKIRTRGADCT